MAFSPIISRLQNNDLTLSKVLKFKTLFFACLTTQKVCSSWMITYIVRQERDRAMKFEIQQVYIVILLLKVWRVLNGVFFLNKILTEVSTLMENDGILLGGYYTPNPSVCLLFLECLTLKRQALLHFETSVCITGHGVTSQKTWTFSNTAMKTFDLE